MGTRWGLFGLVAVAVCLVGGCTSPVGPDSQMGGVSQAPTGSESSDATGVDGGSSSAGPGVGSVGELPQASWSTEIKPPPPMVRYGVYLDGPGGDPAYQAAVTQRNDEIQNAIAACMAAQGFSYVPQSLVSNSGSASTSFDLSLRYLPVPYLPDDRATVVREGYGVMPTAEEQLEARGVMVEDPNAAYTSTLSPAEFKAYQLALFGDYNDPAGTSGSACSGKSMAQFPEVPIPDRQQDFSAEFGSLAAVASIDVESDPRAIQLDAEWGACMKGKGFVVDDGIDTDHGPSLAMFLAERTHPDGTVGPVHFGEVSSADVPVEEKSLLGTEPEREVAVADFDCRVEADYLARLTDIRVSLDDQFIADHQAELDRLVAAAESW